MKAIMMSIRPEWVEKILNKEKTIEIRRRFPKDYVGWVYIYCTKGKPYLSSNSFKYYIAEHYEKYMGNHNGKVVARFWCDKVEHIEYETCSRDISGWWKDNGEMFNHKEACLTYEEMFNYIGSGEGYAIHITKLEIFNKPKPISEFENRTLTRPRNLNPCVVANGYFVRPLTRAPESFCYIEID